MKYVLQYFSVVICDSEAPARHNRHMPHSMPYLKDTILFKLVDQSCLSKDLLCDAIIVGLLLYASLFNVYFGLLPL